MNKEKVDETNVPPTPHWHTFRYNLYLPSNVLITWREAGASTCSTGLIVLQISLTCQALSLSGVVRHNDRQLTEQVVLRQTKPQRSAYVSPMNSVRFAKQNQP